MAYASAQSWNARRNKRQHSFHGCCDIANFFVKRSLEQDAVFWKVTGNGQRKTRRSFYYCQCPAGNLRMLDAAVSSTSRSSCGPVLTTVTHKFRCLHLFAHKRNTQWQPLNQYLVWGFRTQSKIQLMLDYRPVQCRWLITSGICWSTSPCYDSETWLSGWAVFLEAAMHCC
jgi:hypothetical protein